MFLKRHYKLLKLISYETRWFSLQEIAEQLCCSIKTIQRDISQITDFLPIEWSIQTNKHKGIYLNRPLHSSINDIDIKYFKHSLLFQALNIILYEKILTIDQLASHLYIQTTKMRSILNDIENHLKTYELTLKKRPLRIEGNETSIILMYYELYLKSYGPQEWPFNEFQQSMFQTLLNTLENTLEIKFYKNSTRKLSFFIALYLIRKSKKYSIPISDATSQKIQSSSIYKTLLIPIVTIFKDYNVKITTQDIIIIIIALHHTDYHFINKKGIKNLYLSNDIKENEIIYNNLPNLITTLEQTFNIPLQYNEEFIFTILCTIKPHVYKSDFFVAKKFIKPTTTYIKNKHPSTFNQLNTIIDEWLKHLNIKNYVSENEIADLAMYIESILIKKNTKKQKVILHLTQGENWERYLKSFFNAYYNKEIEYISTNSNQLDTLNIEEIACIITDTDNYNLFNNIPNIIISSIPTKRDLEEIRKFI